MPRPGLALAATLLLSACSSGGGTPPPSLAAARTALENVRVETVNQFAATDLRRARDTVESAEGVWRERSDYDEADRLAQQAVAAVRLAEARADAAQARTAREDVAKTLGTLQGEVGRGDPATGDIGLGRSPPPAPPESSRNPQSTVPPTSVTPPGRGFE